jgi:tripartite motif-containing protein 71
MSVPVLATADFSSPNSINIYPNFQFSNPRGVTVDSSDNIYVIDDGNDSNLWKYNGSDWTKIDDSSVFHRATGIALDSSRNIYVTDWNVDTGSGSVKIFNGSTWSTFANSESVFSSVGNCNPYNIAINQSNNNVYVSCMLSSGSANVLKYDGSTWTNISGASTFSNSQAIAIDSSGNVYVTDANANSILKYNGSAWSQFVPNNTLSNPMGLAIGADGYFYVTNRGDNNIVKIDIGGSIVNTYGSEGSSAGQFEQPWGLAINSQNKVFVADNSNNRLQTADFSLSSPTWTLIGDNSSLGRFSSPEDVAVDSSGDIYITDSDNNRVQKYDGSVWTSFGSSEFSSPSNVSVDKDNNVFVTAGGNCIYKYNSLDVYQTSYCTDGAFGKVAFDSQNNMYTIQDSSRITKYNQSEDGWDTYANSQSQGFAYITGIAFDSSDNLYISDNNFFEGIEKIMKYNSTNNWQEVYNSATATSVLSSITSISFDSNNNLYAVDESNHQIVKFSGSEIETFGSQGTGAGHFQDPVNIATYSSGTTLNVFVVDNSNNNFQQLVYDLTSNTPTPTSQDPSDPPSSSGYSAPVCTNSKPLLIPDLFQINTTKTSAKLFFTPIDTNQFYISFSTKPNAEENGEQVTLLKEGVQSETIYFLKSNTTYYIKVRGQNGCMPGDWSHIMKVTTNGSVFYKNYSPVFMNNLSSVSPPVAVPSSPPPTETQPPQPTSQPQPSVTSVTKKSCFLWWCW